MTEMNYSRDRLAQMVEKQAQVADKQYKVEVEVDEEKEETVEIEEDQGPMIDQVHMTGPAPVIDQKVEIDPTVETGVVETEIEVKTQEIKGKIQLLGIPQTYSVIFVK